jgi:hypothetical protein
LRIEQCHRRIPQRRTLGMTGARWPSMSFIGRVDVDLVLVRSPRTSVQHLTG